MTDFSGAVSEANKIVAITKIILNIMKSPGSAGSLRQQNPWKNTPMWPTEINKFVEIEKGLWNWWHSKWMPQALSKETIGSFSTLD
jgi:hypothetical protein